MLGRYNDDRAVHDDGGMQTLRRIPLVELTVVLTEGIRVSVRRQSRLPETPRSACSSSPRRRGNNPIANAGSVGLFALLIPAWVGTSRVATPRHGER